MTSFFGGVLTPNKYKDQISIPGLMNKSAYSDWKVFPNAVPWNMYIYTVGKSGNLGTQLKMEPKFAGSIENLNFENQYGKIGKLPRQIYSRLIIIQETLWESVRIYFFPILGLFIFYFLRIKNKIIDIDTKLFFQFAVVSLFFGFMASRWLD